MNPILSLARLARRVLSHGGTNVTMTRTTFGLCLFILIVCSSAIYAQSATGDRWSDVDENAIVMQGPRLIVPSQYRTVATDLANLRGLLDQAPMERTAGAGGSPILELPLPDGTSGSFRVFETSVMAPELAAKFPEIKTWVGQGLDDPGAIARIDITPAGFHAMILGTAGTIYIDPHHRGDTTHYISYLKHDFVPDAGRLADAGCEVQDEEGIGAEIEELIAGGYGVASGTHLRTYRLAVAATGEYTSFHGGTVAAGMAAIVTAMNRVNGVYERDVAIHMELIPNNDIIIYTNAGTDPYTNHSGYTMLGQNQSNLDAVIGSANYDIGHVFSTGGGGIAGLGVVCRSGQKARGVTGLGSPIGDPFYIDYVAHEMGHQWGGNHAFNGNESGCSGNRTATAAYEPGSGSTIMCYAGLCGSQNLQGLSDDYFHVKSYDQIVAYSTGYYGNSCAVQTLTGNNPPVPNAGPGGYVLPIGTAFALTGAATDPDSDPVTYCWEEWDLGPAGHPNTPSGNAPIFRSWDPTTDPTRYFPKWSSIMSGSTVVGETYPTYTRNLNFRLTVRDNRIGGGGVDRDQISLSVTSSAGPFAITYPNTAVTWDGNTYETISWDVANTNGGSVNCQTVNILLSPLPTQGWPYVLAANTPNDGSETILVPNVTAYLARVMIEAADHIFLDVNDAYFQIHESTTGIADGTRTSSAPRFALHANNPNPFNPSTDIAFELPGNEDHVTLRIYDTAGRLVTTLINSTLAAGAHNVSWDGNDAGGKAVASGIYLYELRAGDLMQARRMVLLK